MDDAVTCVPVGAAGQGARQESGDFSIYNADGSQTEMQGKRASAYAVVIVLLRVPPSGSFQGPAFLILALCPIFRAWWADGKSALRARTEN